MLSSRAISSPERYGKELERLRRELEAAGSAFSGFKDQAKLNQTIGIKLEASIDARDSARVFEQEFERLETIAQQKAAQIGQSFNRSLNEAFGIGGPRAVDLGATFEALEAQAKAEEQQMKLRAEGISRAFTQSLTTRCASA